MRPCHRSTALTQIAECRLSIPFLVLGAVLAQLTLGCGGGGSSGGSSVTSLDPPPEPEPPGEVPASPFTGHVDQARIRSGAMRFRELFIIGDELFETAFNSLDGVGALRLPDSTAHPTRFSRSPPGGGRFTGPNGQACNACHNVPFGTSAGEASSNVLQDPARAGLPPFNTRNTISLFGSGLIQRLAEEMTEELLLVQDEASASALPGGPPVSRPLAAKGISFGSISASRDGGGVLTIDMSAVEGVSSDLVIRPFGWKGGVPTVRAFVRDAARNELGMEADELVVKTPADGPDPDGDGVEGELSVGDITALTIYVAAQESPTTRERMARLRQMAPPGAEFEAASRRGSSLFSEALCDSCHVRELRILDPIFEEPTLRGGGNYRDEEMDPAATSLDPAAPLRFDLGADGDFPRAERHPAGGLRVPLFGDLKRHFMGSALADSQTSPVVRASGQLLISGEEFTTVAVGIFLTPELWGVGNTGPWLHDGRAATLEEAIRLHGVASPSPPGDPARSEAQDSRDAFEAFSAGNKEDLVTFLRSLILFERPVAEEE